MEVLIKDIANTYLPELVLLIFIMINMAASIFLHKNMYRISKGLTIVGIVCAIAATFYLPVSPEDSFAFGGAFLSNVYTLFFKILILISAFFLTLLSRNMVRSTRELAFEYFTVFLSGVLFAMCCVSVMDFVGLFVCLSALGLSCYLLLTYTKSSNARQLSFGYLVIGGVASSLFLLGLSYLYGLCGQFGFVDISNYFSQNPPHVLLTFALILMTVTILFKLGIVPFSSWLPDTFQGAGYPIAAYISMIPPLACFGILARLLLIMMPFTNSLRLVFASIAVLTIICGSLCAIRQSNVKRLMAYSMSVQSGIMLLGLCVFSVYSLSSVLFYLFFYLFANIGAWSAIILFYNSCKLDEINDFKGLIYHRPYYVIAFTVILLSLAGIAPTCGFVAKLFVFSAVARSGFVFLPFLAVAMLASVIMIFAYWKIIRAMFRRVENSVEIDTNVISSKFLLYACAFATVLCCIFADKIFGLTQLVSYYM